MANGITSRFPIQERRGAVGASQAVGRTRGIDPSAITARINEFAQRKLVQAQEEAVQVNLGAGVEAANRAIAEGRGLEGMLESETAFLGARDVGAAAFNRGVRSVFKTQVVNDTIADFQTIREQIRAEGVPNFDEAFRVRAQEVVAETIARQNEIDPSGQFAAELQPQLDNILSRAFTAEVAEKARLDEAQLAADAKTDIEDARASLNEIYFKNSVGSEADRDFVQGLLEDKLEETAIFRRLTPAQIEQEKQRLGVEVTKDWLRGVFFNNVLQGVDPDNPNVAAELARASAWLDGLERDAISGAENVFGDDDDARALEAELRQELNIRTGAARAKKQSVRKFINHNVHALINGQTFDPLFGAPGQREFGMNLGQLYAFELNQELAAGNSTKAAEIQAEIEDVALVSQLLQPLNEGQITSLAGIEGYINRLEDPNGLLATVDPALQSQVVETAKRRLDEMKTAVQTGEYTGLYQQSAQGLFDAAMQDSGGDYTQAVASFMPGYTNEAAVARARVAIAQGRNDFGASLPLSKQDTAFLQGMIQRATTPEEEFVAVSAFLNYSAQLTGKPLAATDVLENGGLYKAVAILEQTGLEQAGAEAIAFSRRAMDEDQIRKRFGNEQASLIATKRGGLMRDEQVKNRITALTRTGVSNRQGNRTALQGVFWDVYTGMLNDADGDTAAADERFMAFIKTIPEPEALQNGRHIILDPEVRNTPGVGEALQNWTDEEWLAANVEASIYGGPEMLVQTATPVVLPSSEGYRLVLMAVPNGEPSIDRNLVKDTSGNRVEILLAPEGPQITAEELTERQREAQFDTDQHLSRIRDRQIRRRKAAEAKGEFSETILGQTISRTAGGFADVFGEAGGILAQGFKRAADQALDLSPNQEFRGRRR